jgi:hydroxymethylbilane synthase
MSRIFTLGTRGSPLALAQAHMVAAALEAAHGWPRATVVIRPVKTSGDRIQDRPLSEVGGKALWTKELDIALADGETDFSVHSMKDVESERPGAFVLPAMLERADPRDRIIGASGVAAIPEGATVGTSSPRRTAQLLHLRPDINVVPIRGNVQTRLNKIAAGEVDATFLAAAGLDRLGIKAGEAVPIDVMTPAPGQAAVGIECRTDDKEVRALLEAINHRQTCREVALERAFTRRLGGTCHSPVGAFARTDMDGRVRLRAQLLSEDGRAVATEEVVVADEAEAVALAERMLSEAEPSIRRLFEGA